MLGVADSLNVSVSAAILFYEARRQRGAAAGVDRGVTVDTLRFRDHRRRPGRRGRRVQGARAGRVRRHRRSRAGSAGAARTSAACRRSRCSTAPPGITPTRPRTTGRGVGGARLHGQPAAGRRRTRRFEPFRRAASTAGAVAYRGIGVDRRPRPGRRPARRAPPTSCAADERRRRRRLGHQAAADRGHRRDPDLDQPRGDARPRAAGEPARPRRRADRLRAGPGLCPVRRADHDRPVGAAAGADRPSAQLRGRSGRPSSGTA